MRYVLFLCSALLLIALLDLPIGYYTFLRIVVTIGAIAAIYTEYAGKFNLWIMTFGLIAILFNPIMPIYLHDLEVWAYIDVIVSVLFLVKGLGLKNKSND